MYYVVRGRMGSHVKAMDLLQTVVILIVIVIVWLALQHKSNGPQPRSVAIVVLGDIGRSPRIMYHAQSFAANEFETYIVGYQGACALLQLPLVLIFYRLARSRHAAYPSPRPLRLPARPARLHLEAAPASLHPPRSPQSCVPARHNFGRALLPYRPTPRVHSRPGQSGRRSAQSMPLIVMVRKNPPSVPTLALVWLAGKVRGSKVIIDWHNLGYSILALKLGDKHILVRLAKG